MSEELVRAAKECHAAIVKSMEDAMSKAGDTTLVVRSLVWKGKMTEAFQARLAEEIKAQGGHHGSFEYEGEMAYYEGAQVMPAEAVPAFVRINNDFRWR